MTKYEVAAWLYHIVCDIGIVMAMIVLLGTMVDALIHGLSEKARDFVENCAAAGYVCGVAALILHYVCGAHL